ncbi:dihydrofolate reductase [Rhodovibrio sodomensis]|nr:dihydrofolate reductase [Rhodovibrio sodomensis]
MCRIVIISAVAANGVIGQQGRLPWHLPSDLGRFKRRTQGHPLIMGRRTFESLPGVLPGRPHIILTRQQNWHQEGVRTAHDIDQALEEGCRLARELGVDAFFVIGGGEVYRQALPHAHEIDITRVPQQAEGDARFPAIDPQHWRLSRTETLPEQSGEPPLAVELFHRRAEAMTPADTRVA